MHLFVENVTVKGTQIFLRTNHIDEFAGEKSFITGQSTANQRIEWFWGLLRRQVAQFWMNLFAKLRDNDMFNGSAMDKSLIRFCFLDMVQVLQKLLYFYSTIHKRTCMSFIMVQRLTLWCILATCI